MFDLVEIAAAVNEGVYEIQGHTLLVYGGPKTGKTRLSATIAKLPWVRNVHYFGFENGHDTLITMTRKGDLSQEAAKKIHIYRIKDTPDKSRAMEIALKGFVSEHKGRLCKEHGRFECLECQPKKDFASVEWLSKSIAFDVKTLTHDDWVIFDSGTQLAASCLAYITKGRDYDFKPGWDEYGQLGRMLTDFCSYVQAAARCNFMVLTHELVLENNELEKKDKFYPLFGTKPFSLTVAKFFGTVIHLELNMRKHSGASASTFKDSVVSGSRVDMRIEDEAQLDFSLVWPKLGLKRPEAVVTTKTETAVKPAVIPPK